MSDTRTLTADEIDSRMNACGAGGTGVWRLGIEGVAAQAKRVPELEAAHQRALVRFDNLAAYDAERDKRIVELEGEVARLTAELDRYLLAAVGTKAE